MVEANAYIDIHRSKQELEVLKELKTLKESNGSAFYVPHRKQDLFHSNADKKYRYVRTGNRWGKSQCGAAEDVAWARGFREWYKEGDPRRYVGIPARSTVGVVIVHDWGKAEEIFTNQVQGTGRGKLFDYIPPSDLVKVNRSSGGNIDTIVIKSKWGGSSTIRIDTVKSFMQNPEGHESSQWDWIHVDEPIPRDMWVAYSRGLMDSGGSAWFLCTPLNQAWINDFFIPTRRTKLDVESASIFNKKMVIIGSTKDNPHITAEAREDYESTLKPDEIACRLHGVPKAMTGMVYKNFDPEFSPVGHVYEDNPVGWENPVCPPSNYTIRYAIDPHPQTPHAVMFAATAPTGEVFFFKEIFEQTMMDNLADQILAVVSGRYVMTSIADPSAFINNPITGETMADKLAGKGVYVEKAVKDLARGIIAVNASLKKVMPEGHKWLNFHSSMTETLWEFDHYEWDSKRENKPVDKDDHMLENLYRLVLNGLEYVDPMDYSEQYIPQADIRELDLRIPKQSETVPQVDRELLSAEERYLLYRLGL